MSYRYKYNRTLVPFSQANTTGQTDAEKLLWHRLRNRQLKGYKFRRQYPTYNYIIYFHCSEKNLAIEVDGSQHIERKYYDRKRKKSLQYLGIHTILFWDNDVLKNIDGVLEQILIALNRTPDEKPLPNPHPKGEGADARFKDQFVRVKKLLPANKLRNV